MDPNTHGRLRLDVLRRQFLPSQAPRPSGRSSSAFARELVTVEPARELTAGTEASWRLSRVISGHAGWVLCVAVEPENSWFATGSADRTIKVWDLASGRQKVTLTGHVMGVRALAASDRMPYLFSAGEDKRVRCWDLEYNRVVRDFHGHLSAVYSLALHPVLDVLVTGGRDCAARVWDIRTRAAVHVLEGHTGPINAVRCQDVDPQVVTGSQDSTVRLWDLAAGKTSTVLTHSAKSVRALAVHPSEFSFAAGGQDGIRQFAFHEGRFMGLLSPFDNTTVNCLALNDDNVLVAGGNDGLLQFYDWVSASRFQSLRSHVLSGTLSAENAIYAAEFDRTGLRLITCEGDKTVKIWKQQEAEFVANPETSQSSRLAPSNDPHAMYIEY